MAVRMAVRMAIPAALGLSLSRHDYQLQTLGRRRGMAGDIEGLRAIPSLSPANNSPTRRILSSATSSTSCAGRRLLLFLRFFANGEAASAGPGRPHSSCGRTTCSCWSCKDLPMTDLLNSLAGLEARRVPTGPAERIRPATELRGGLWRSPANSDEGCLAGDARTQATPELKRKLLDDPDYGRLNAGEQGDLKVFLGLQ